MIENLIELTFMNEGCKSIDHSYGKRNCDYKKYIQYDQSPHEARVSSFLLKVMTVNTNRKQTISRQFANIELLILFNRQRGDMNINVNEFR